MQVGGEAPGGARLASGVQGIDQGPTLAVVQGRLQGLDPAPATLRGQAQAVLNNLQGPRLLAQDADVALLGEQGLDLLDREARRDRDTEGDQDPKADTAGAARISSQMPSGVSRRTARPQPRQKSRPARAKRSLMWSFSSVMVPTVEREVRTGLV